MTSSVCVCHIIVVYYIIVACTSSIIILFPNKLCNLSALISPVQFLLLLSVLIFMITLIVLFCYILYYPNKHADLIAYIHYDFNHCLRW